MPASVNDTLSQQAAEIVNGTKDVDKSLSDVQSQLQKAVTPVNPPKINDTELLKRTAKKAVAARKELSSVGKSLGQVADGLKVSADAPKLVLADSKLSVKIEIPDYPTEKPQFSQDPT